MEILMKLLCIIIQVMVIRCQNLGGFDVTYAVTPNERLQFGEMELATVTDASVYHLEADRYIPGNLLFSEGHSLRTTNLVVTTTIAGSITSSGNINGVGGAARFNALTGFLQLNQTHVTLVDYANHCLRLYDRVTYAVSDYVGSCPNPGFVNGFGVSAKFYYPNGIIKYNTNPYQVIIPDNYNNALRMLDLRTKYVSTIIHSAELLYRPTAMTWEQAESDYSLLITVNSGIQRLTLSSLNLTQVSGSRNDNRFFDGSLTQAAYYNPSKIVPFFYTGVFAVADRQNGRVRLVDLVNNRVSSICAGLDSTPNLGPLHRCTLYEPRSLLLRGNTLYVGQKQRISKISVIWAEDTCSSNASTVGKVGSTEEPTTSPTVPQTSAHTPSTRPPNLPPSTAETTTPATVMPPLTTTTTIHPVASTKPSSITAVTTLTATSTSPIITTTSPVTTQPLPSSSGPESTIESNNSSTDNANQTTTWIVAGVAVAVVIILVLLLSILWIKLKRRSSTAERQRPLPECPVPLTDRGNHKPQEPFDKLTNTNETTLNISINAIDATGLSTGLNDLNKGQHEATDEGESYCIPSCTVKGSDHHEYEDII